MTDTTATDAAAISWRDEDVRGFGMAIGGRAQVLRPTTATA